MSSVALPITNSCIINSSIDFSRSILEGSDPVEEKMNRTSSRIGGFVVGFLLGGPLNICYLADAMTDSRKVLVIENHLAALKDTGENKIEKQIYTEIASYTKNARMIKLVTSIAGIASFIGLNMDLMQGNISASTQSCLAAFGTGIAASIIHRYTIGSSMKESHKQLILGTLEPSVNS